MPVFVKESVHIPALGFLGRLAVLHARPILYHPAVVFLWALALALVVMSTSARWRCPKHQPCTDQFRWDRVVPHRSLHWEPCYGKYQCARLQVPLDYSDPQGAQAAIALYKLPALTKRHDRKYRGPILINPGGPGNPPFILLQSMGQRFQSVVGTEFDIVAFDPRGVGETTPLVFAFEDSAERETWTLLEPPFINASSDALSKRVARAHVINDLIKQKSGDVAQHVNSAVVARDMLSIVQAHGFSQLQYWGLSYGAVLGLTYAKMFPDKVARMVLDGMPDINDYYATKWASNLADTSQTVQAFYDACAAAGPERCALASVNATPAHVQGRVEALYATVRTRPVPGFESGAGVYGVVDYSTLQQAFLDALYTPYDTFPAFARALAELESGNGTQILSRTRSPRSWCPKCDGPPRWNGYRVEARLATMCTDGEPVRDSEEELLAHYRRLAEHSSFADTWAGFRLGCSGWDVRPKWHVAGPFSGNSSSPLLFLGNTVDPISPLRYMDKTSSNYVGSSLLVQEAFGHCSTVATSKCTDQWVHTYFQTGRLPPPSTTCKVDVELFGGKMVREERLSSQLSGSVSEQP